MNEQARIGILALDTRFPRIPGDVGNPATWPFPVRIEVVPGATPERVVHGQGKGLLPDFIAAGQRLVDEGVEVIVTTCGFLSLMQAELRAALPVPVVTSALMQLPLIAAMLPPGKVAGIVTASARSLTKAHLVAAGASPDVPVSGVPEDSEFARVFLGNRETLDEASARHDVLGAAQFLVETWPVVGAIVLECANMGPYAADVARETGLPVHDMVSLVRWLHQGLAPLRFGK